MTHNEFRRKNQNQQSENQEGAKKYSKLNYIRVNANNPISISVFCKPEILHRNNGLLNANPYVL